MEEAYILFEPIANKLRATLSSWDEANYYCLDGYSYWGRIILAKRLITILREKDMRTLNQMEKLMYADYFLTQ